MNATTTIAGAPQYPTGRPTSPTGALRTTSSGRNRAKRVAYRNLWISVPGPAVRLRRLGHVGIITVQMLNLGFFTQAELFTLTAIAGMPARPCASRRRSSSACPAVTQHDLPDHRDAAGPGHRHRHRAAAQGLAAVGLPADGAVVRRGRRQLRQLDVQHQHLLPEAAAGHGAGPERRPGQLRRDDHADRHPAGDDGAAARRPGRRAETLLKDSGWIFGKIASGTPTWIQNAGFAWVMSLVPLSILCWFGMNNLKTVSPDTGSPSPPSPRSPGSTRWPSSRRSWGLYLYLPKPTGLGLISMWWRSRWT